MFQITINEKGGKAKQESFEKTEITIGRVQDNDVILPKGNISKRHSRIVLKDGKFIIVDLKSTNGTYVNGKKITAPQVVKSTDKIYIGDFTLQLTSLNGASAQAAEPVESRSKPPSAAKDDGIDLFGGDALDADAEPAGAGVPGLIDDNFDQEFDAPDPAPKLPKPSKRRAPEPEPEAAELDLDDDFGDPDLEPDFDIPDPEPELDPAFEPELPKVSAKSKKSSRRSASRNRPARAKVDLEPEPLDDDVGLSPVSSGAPTSMPAPAPVAMAASAPALEREEILRRCHHHLVDALALRGIELSALPGQKTRAEQEATSWLQQQQTRGRVAADEDIRALAKEAAALAIDLSLILDLIQDETVVEIAVTHDRQVLADREGRLEPIDRMISSEDQVVALVRRLGVLGGADPGPDEPLVDVRLRDGARVVASLPPLSFRGPTLSYRKTTRDFYTLERLFAEYSTISESMMKLIDYCVRFKKNVLLSVGPGVTPTATLNALAAQMPTDDRIVSIETGIELHLASHRNVTALERRGGVDDARLIEHAIALQADRVIVGSLGGPSCARLLEAIAGPLEGSVAAFPASSPSEALARLSKRDLAAAYGGDIGEARRALAAAFPVVLQEAKFLDNSRRITKISELLVDDDEVRVEDIFVFKPEGVDENAIVTGSFWATGHTPRFLEELVDRGEADVDMDIFKS